MRDPKPHSFDFETGEVLLFDKPYGWTSFDLVGKVRSLITRREGIKKLKVGHTGTLDPLATGLMIVCTGKFTKRIQEFMGLEKRYRMEMELGRTTPSFDLETSFDGEYDYSGVKEDDIRQVLQKFTGEQDQIPPVYSAKYINGDRAYSYARKGKTPELKASRIVIYELSLRTFAPPLVEMEVFCGKGTYIRALVRDIGNELGCGGFLKTLVRTEIGPHSLSNAMSIENFEKMLYNI